MQDQFSQTGVAGRLQLQHRVGFHRVKRLKMIWYVKRGPLAAKIFVAQQRRYRRMATGHRHVELLPKYQLTHLAEAVIERVRGCVEGGVSKRL